MIEISGKRFLAAIATVMALLSCSSSLAQSSWAEIKQRGLLKVGTFTYIPESWLDPSTGAWRGIDADITMAIGKRLGIRVEPVFIVHSAILPSISSGRVDVIAGLYRTPAREGVLAFGAEPMWFGTDVIVAHADNNSIEGLQSLKGKSLGTERGGAQETVADKLKQEFGLAEIRKFESAEPMLMDVVAGRLDAATWFGFTFEWQQRNGPKMPLKVVSEVDPRYYGLTKLPANWYVFSKDNSKEIIVAFDNALRDIRVSGEMKSILAKYGLTSESYLDGRVR